MASVLQDHGEPIPERTTPQGTQAEGVEHGHEERDVDLLALIKWFSGLAAGIAIAIIVVLGIYRSLGHFVARGDRVDSPMLAERTNPPLPHMLPNRVDSPPDKVVGLPQPLQVPSEYYRQQRAIENKKLEELGLRNPETGTASLPEDKVAAVLNAPEVKGAVVRPGTGIDGVRHETPAGYSGGTRMENKLR